MIAYLSGKIKYLGSNWLILDVGGVGYKIFINSKFQTLSSKQIQNFNKKKSKSLKNLDFENSKIVSSLELNTSNLTAELYIYHHIREDADDLYGLDTPEELQMFELLVSVSGVGPKMAMNILSTYDTAKINQIIINSDAGSLTAVSGVGKKLSMKMILDLKSKLDSGAINSFSDFDSSSQEVADALESLGYKRYEISQYLAKIPQELTTTQDKVKWILKNIKR